MATYNHESISPAAKTERSGEAMKIISGNASGDLSLELKYCERCGGLWLRPAGESRVYCAPCTREVEEMPPTPRESQVLKGRQARRKSAKRVEPAWTGNEAQGSKDAAGGAA